MRVLLPCAAVALLLDVCCGVPYKFSHHSFSNGNGGDDRRETGGSHVGNGGNNCHNVGNDDNGNSNGRHVRSTDGSNYTSNDGNSRHGETKGFLYSK